MKSLHILIYRYFRSIWPWTTFAKGKKLKPKAGHKVNTRTSKKSNSNVQTNNCSDRFEFPSFIRLGVPWRLYFVRLQHCLFSILYNLSPHLKKIRIEFKSVSKKSTVHCFEIKNSCTYYCQLQKRKHKEKKTTCILIPEKCRIRLGLSIYCFLLRECVNVRPSTSGAKQLCLTQMKERSIIQLQIWKILVATKNS